MSSAVAIIHVQDGTVFHGRYDGTVDVLRPYLYVSPQERDAVFYLRGEDEPRGESCGCPAAGHAWAWADTDYASITFPIRVCVEHRRVHRQWRHYPMERPTLEEIGRRRAAKEPVPLRLLWSVEDDTLEVPWEPDWTTSEGPTDYLET